jgi:hypothetical protein
MLALRCLRYCVLALSLPRGLVIEDESLQIDLSEILSLSLSGNSIQARASKVRCPSEESSGRGLVGREEFAGDRYLRIIRWLA